MSTVRRPRQPESAVPSYTTPWKVPASGADTHDSQAESMFGRILPATMAALDAGLRADQHAIAGIERDAWEQVGHFRRTRTCWKRFRQLAELAQEVVRRSVPGDFAEFGVWRGGTVYLVARLWEAAGEERDLLAFDSYEGLPEPDGRLDGVACRTGLFGDVDFDEIRRFFLDAELPRVRLVRGWFDQTISTLASRRLALCHVDADCYESVRSVLPAAWEALSPGGYLVCDDFRHPACAGSTVAFEEFFARRPEMIRQTPGFEQSCFVRKLA